MKIALFSWEARYAVEIGGVAAHVSDLADALARLGHEVHIFTRQAPGQTLDDLICGVWYHRCPCPRKDAFLDEVRAFNNSLCYYYMEAAAANGGFDVIHCHDWLCFSAGLRLRNECRLIATFHTTEWGRSGAWPESGQARHIADLEAEMTQKADAVIAVSYEVRRQTDLLYRCPDWKLSVIYHGIDLRRFTASPDLVAQTRAEHGLPADAPLALYVGSLTLRKGADILVSALPKTLEHCPQARLALAGEGEMRGQLEGMARGAGITGSVHFCGVPAEARLRQLYAACDVVCIPYRYDPFGVVALAAWAAGKPVVVCGEGAAAEFVYNKVNGLRCSAEGLGTALGELLSEADNMRWMGRNGRVAVETAFSWEAVAEQTLSAYDAREAVAK